MTDTIQKAREALATATVAMKIASALPNVSDEYDFGPAIAECAAALASATPADEARADHLVYVFTQDEMRDVQKQLSAAEAKLAEARKVIESYWRGKYWAMMGDNDADVVNALLFRNMEPRHD